MHNHASRNGCNLQILPASLPQPCATCSCMYEVPGTTTWTRIHVSTYPHQHPHTHGASSMFWLLSISSLPPRCG